MCSIEVVSVVLRCDSDHKGSDVKFGRLFAGRSRSSAPLTIIFLRLLSAHLGRGEVRQEQFCCRASRIYDVLFFPVNAVVQGKTSNKPACFAFACRQVKQAFFANYELNSNIPLSSRATALDLVRTWGNWTSKKERALVCI